MLTVKLLRRLIINTIILYIVLTLISLKVRVRFCDLNSKKGEQRDKLIPTYLSILKGITVTKQAQRCRGIHVP